MQKNKTLIVKLIAVFMAVILLVLGTGWCLGYRVEKKEKARIENINGIRVANLYGTWKEMGQQYGRFFGGDLKNIYENYIYAPVADDPEKFAGMKQIAYSTYHNYPEELEDFFEGMAETSGLTMEQLIMDNSIERIFSATFSGPGCSAFVVWDEYAADKLVFGRNYDYTEVFRSFKDYFAVTVYHPSDGSKPAATAGYIGEIYCVNGMDADGIFYSLNSGSPSITEKAMERLPFIAGLLMLQFSMDDLEYAEGFFETEKAQSSYIINMADKNEARSFEWCKYGMKRGDGMTPDGLLVATNHFVNPEWEFELPTDEKSYQSVTRRANILKYAEANKGTIDAEKMMTFLDTPIEEGGATMNLTVYQIVAVPEDRCLWVKVTGGNGWTRIDLKDDLKR